MTTIQGNKKQITLFAAIVIALVTSAIAAMLPLFRTENARSVDASYAYLEKGEHRDSLLPYDLSAAIVPEKDGWVANGPVTTMQLEEFVREHKPVGQLKLRNSDINAEHLSSLAGCGLTYLGIYNNDLGPDELAAISRIDSLKSILLEDNNLTDSELLHLTGPAGVESLELNQNQAGDRFIEHLPATFPNLSFLDLSRTGVHGKSLVKLAGMSRLRELRLFACREVGINDLKALKKLLPSTKIKCGAWEERFQDRSQ
ncbi:MAG: hypothetical protein IPM23_21605 [Candidatus Melainabacteria bacterium]|nr:hypothetical protein [Candidatus Melainabacteria bacterium]